MTYSSSTFPVEAGAALILDTDTLDGSSNDSSQNWCTSGNVYGTGDLVLVQPTMAVPQLQTCLLVIWSLLRSCGTQHLSRIIVVNGLKYTTLQAHH